MAGILAKVTKRLLLCRDLYILFLYFINIYLYYVRSLVTYTGILYITQRIGIHWIVYGLHLFYHMYMQIQVCN